jgi:hypothetical protein
MHVTISDRILNFLNKRARSGKTGNSTYKNFSCFHPTTSPSCLGLPLYRIQIEPRRDRLGDQLAASSSGFHVAILAPPSPRISFCSTWRRLVHRRFCSTWRHMEALGATHLGATHSCHAATFCGTDEMWMLHRRGCSLASLELRETPPLRGRSSDSLAPVPPCTAHTWGRRDVDAAIALGVLRCNHLPIFLNDRHSSPACL